MSLGELGLLSDTEYAELNDRVDRFHDARRADPAVALDSFLPPPGGRLRAFVLVELIKTDMELRVRAGTPVRVESYLARFRTEFPEGRTPVSLIAEEYRLRHRHGDRPGLGEYRERFAEQFEAFVAAVDADPFPSRPEPSRDVSVGFESMPEPPTPADDGAAPTRLTGADPPKAPKLPPKPTKGPPKVPTKSPSIPGVKSGSPSGVLRDVLPAGLGYKLIRRIGKGAYGEVFEAEAPGGVKVAIKRIIRSMDHPASKGEIESLEAIKSLSHPFLLKTSAFWEFEDRLIIVMELADESLYDRIDAHKKAGQPGVPPEELIPIFEQAAAALDYLHRMNVSHRDVKPPNILLQRGYAKVADFGLARNHEHTLTNVGTEIGTPVFMAPEVWNHKVSLHSDQYSLAATYVAARIGRPPFSARLIHELAAAHVSGKPELDPLPAAEQKVVLKALAKLPDQRYPSCEAFAKALRKAVLDPPEPKDKRPWNPLAIAGALMLMLGLGIGIASQFWPRPDPPPPGPGTGGGGAGGGGGTQPKVLPCPQGWTPVSAAGIVTVDGREYHKRLTRTVAGEELVALLIPRTRPNDPPSFYMLENKITNKVFAAEWDRAILNPTSPVHTFLQDNPELRDRLCPGQWRNGVPDTKGNRVSIDKQRPGTDYSQYDTPALGVTVPEAMLIAQELGGLLPIRTQWTKAVGIHDGKSLPTGPPIEVPSDKSELDDRLKYLRDTLRGRNLALGLQNGPLPVSRRTADFSFFDVHQLLSNGQEWTGDNPYGERRLNLFELPTTDYHAFLVGQAYEKTEIPTVFGLLNQKRSQPWTKWNEYAGFRIVLEMP